MAVRSSAVNLQITPGTPAASKAVLASAALSVLIICLAVPLRTLYYSSRNPAILKNEIQVRAPAEASEQAIRIPFAQTAPLARYTTAQLLAIRKQRVGAPQQFMAREYIPSSVVFGALRSSGPWVSEAGFWALGRGMNSQEGSSHESLYILNPYLLVGAELWGLSIWSRGGQDPAIRWNPAVVKVDDLTRKEFPLHPQPSRLLWHGNSAEVTYNVSVFLLEAAPYVLTPPKRENIWFGLSAVNARDLGFDFISFNPKASSNVRDAGTGGDILPLNDHYEWSTKWDPKTPTNYRPLPPTELNNFSISTLPATAVLNLWRNVPKESGSAPDFQMKINFE